MLALYDLCAVLTPCGPLKVLVHLMQERNEPLPGLLYEADLPQPENTRNSQPIVNIPAPAAIGFAFGSLGMLMTQPASGTRQNSSNAQPPPHSGIMPMGYISKDSHSGYNTASVNSEHGSSSAHGLVNHDTASQHSDEEQEGSKSCY